MRQFIARSFLGLALSLNCMTSTAQEAPVPDEPPGGDGVAQSLIEAILMKEAMDIMVQNIEASKRESGEIDKLVRALSGVSIKDIEEYGICGGPNSEVRNLFGGLCNDIK